MTSAEVDYKTGLAVVKGKGIDAQTLLKAVDDAEGGDYKATVKK